MEKTYQITESELQAKFQEQKELCAKYLEDVTHDRYLVEMKKYAPLPDLSNLVKNDVTNDKGIGLYLTNRIKQLNEADAAFCDIRWQQGLPIDMNMAKRIAREESNKVTFARQELEMVLKLLNSGKGVQECDASKAKSMGEPMAQNKSGQQLTECYVPVTNDEQLSIDFDTSKAMALGWFPSPHGWLKEKK
jgi:hypothetical protein